MSGCKGFTLKCVRDMIKTYSLYMFADRKKMSYRPFDLSGYALALRMD